MNLLVLISLLLGLFFAALPKVEGRCAVTQNTVSVVGPSNFRDPSQYGYVLRGISKGNAPTSFTWRREGVVLSSSAPYSIADPVLLPVENSCSGRLYESQLTVTGKVTGEFTYNASNEMLDDVEGTLTIEAADNPSNLMLRQNGRFTVEVSWTLSATPPSRGYVLTTGSDPFTGTTITNPHTYTVPTIAVGDVITFRLVAASRHFFSEVLGPKSITIREILAPIITSSVTATSATLLLVQTMDSIPANYYGVTLTRRIGQADCPYVADTATMLSDSNSVLFEGLEEYSVYSVMINVITTYMTRSIRVADITTKTAVPDASPYDFTNSTVASRSVTLTWRNIDCIQRNGRITSFEIQYEQVAGALTTMTISTSSTTSYTVEGLLPFTEYRFRLAGVNIDGTGPYTAFIIIRTDEDVPGAVSGVTGNAKFYSVELSWSPPQMPNGILTGYGIMYTVNDSSSRTAQVTATSNPLHMIANLQPQTTISNITVTASTRIGAGPSAQFSNVFTTLLKPPMVTHVVVTVLNDISVRVLWDRPRIREITQFMIIYSRTEKRNQQEVSIITVNSTENSVDISDLITGAEYQFQVVAQAEVGGETIVGQRSLLTSTSVVEVKLSCPTSPVGITGILVFILTVVLYSIILTLVLLGIYYHRKRNSSQQEQVTVHRHEGVNSRYVMELKECQAYGQVSVPKHTTERVPPANIEYEEVYYDGV